MNLTEWLDEIMPSVSGITVALASRHIIGGVIDFCNMSLVLTEELAPIDVVADTASYSLAPVTANTEIAQVLEVYVNNCWIPVTNWTKVNSDYSNAKVRTGDAIGYIQAREDVLTLFPIPRIAYTDGLKVKVALRPIRTATEIEDAIGARYFDAIADAIFARIYKIPSKPWSDGQAAVFYENKAKTKAQIAKDEVTLGMGRSRRRTRIFN